MVLMIVDSGQFWGGGGLSDIILVFFKGDFTGFSNNFLELN